MGWRYIILEPEAVRSYPQKEQKEQNHPPEVSFADIADIADSSEGVPSTSIEPVEAVALPSPVTISQPIPPIRPGWLVTYRDAGGRVRGGCDERDHGTVAAMAYSLSGWTVTLTDGTRLPLSVVRAVAQTDSTGQVVEAWLVRAHGVDGLT